MSFKIIYLRSSHIIEMEITNGLTVFLLKKRLHTEYKVLNNHVWPQDSNLKWKCAANHTLVWMCSKQCSFSLENRVWFSPAEKHWGKKDYLDTRKSRNSAWPHRSQSWLMQPKWERLNMDLSLHKVLPHWNPNHPTHYTSPGKSNSSITFCWLWENHAFICLFYLIYNLHFPLSKWVD